MIRHYTRRSLKAKLALWSAAAMVVVVLAVTSFALWVLQADMRRSASDAQTALVASIAIELDSRIDERRLALVQAAAVLGNLPAVSPAALRDHFDTRPVLQDMFDVLLIADVDGKLVFDSPQRPGRVGLSIADREYFKEAMATGHAVISPPLAGRATTQPNVIFAAPLHDKAGRNVGALLGLLYLNRPNFLGNLANVKIGRSGYVAVVSKGDPAQVVMHADRSRIMTPVPANSHVQRALAGFEGTVETTNSVGLEALYSYRSLKQVPWVVTTAYPTAEAYAELRSSQRLVAVLGGVLMMLAGTGIWLLVDRLLAPLDRLRLAMVESRNRSDPVVVEGGDQTREIAEVVDAFNALMAHKQEARAALQRNEERIKLITDNIPVQLAYIDSSQRYQFVNESFARAIGTPSQSLTGKTVREVRGERIFRQVEARLSTAMRGSPVTFEGEYPHPAGAIHYRTDYVPDTTADGTVRGIFAMTQIITAQKLADAKVAASEKRLRMIADNLPVLISYIDDQQRMQFVNRTYRDWTDIDPDKVVGRTVADVVGPARYEPRRAHLAAALAGKRVEFDIVSTTQSMPRHLHTVYVPDLRADGTVAGLYALSADVTALKLVEARLQEQARVDSLTALPNRRAFDERLRECVARSRRTDRRMALMFIDIDHFKAINDTHGHGGGDQVLQDFARRLLSCVRQSDTVARLAGDEFVIILENLRSVDESTVVAQKIGQRMRSPFIVGDKAIDVSASIGVAYVDDDTAEAAQVVEKADGALYRAKRNGRNTFAVTTW